MGDVTHPITIFDTYCMVIFAAFVGMNWDAITKHLALLKHLPEIIGEIVIGVLSCILDVLDWINKR